MRGAIASPVVRHAERAGQERAVPSWPGAGDPAPGEPAEFVVRGRRQAGQPRLTASAQRLQELVWASCWSPAGGVLVPTLLTARRQAHFPVSQAAQEVVTRNDKGGSASMTQASGSAPAALRARAALG